MGKVAHDISKLLVLLCDKVETTFTLGRAIAGQVSWVRRVVSTGVSNTPNVFDLAAEHLAQLFSLE